jgi:hypothetical protein
LGGNVNPAAKVHFNTSATNDTIKFSNSITGHAISDGTEIRTTGNNTRIINRENAFLLLGTNNTDRLSITGVGNIGIGIITPNYLLDVKGDSSTVSNVNGTGTLHSTGIFRSEYTGNVADDHIAIMGRSVPSLTDNHGIGVYAEGGYIGVNGFAKCASALSVFGSINESYSRGETYGTYSVAQSDTTNKGGLKYGLFANAAGGNSNFGVYGTADTTGAPTTSYAGYFDGKTQVVGNLNVTGNLSKGAGTFKIDHPLDPENKYLYHSFVESPDMMNIYNGNCVTNANGKCIVELPSYFEALNKDFRYQLTCIGQPAMVWVEKKINNNHFVIKSDKPNVEISWQVTGIRQDPYANNHRVVQK